MALHYSDFALIQGLKQNKSGIIQYFYKEFLPVIRSLVERNSGTRQDVEDVFQDAIFVLYKRSCDGSIQLACSLKTYFYAISKNIWLQRLERKYRLLYQASFEVQEEKGHYITEDSDINEFQIEKMRLLQKHFYLLPPDCQRILRLFFTKTSLKEITIIMNYKNVTYAKERKYLCKNMLRKKIMNDPNCHQFIQYE
ncbi:MAG: sigma-70 family RNA polymerase sigma factor [Bacteroidales bacterium]|nr:sigma-70 family RNA polymerase sigma factor [Bacteroidales bacterium]MDD4604093.1 sigma-70 family RNA polymerase sigma factor [Bacteroidales bacterium]